jgi:hypothetical protein
VAERFEGAGAAAGRYPAIRPGPGGGPVQQSHPQSQQSQLPQHSQQSPQLLQSVLSQQSQSSHQASRGRPVQASLWSVQHTWQVQNMPA